MRRIACPLSLLSLAILLGACQPEFPVGPTASSVPSTIPIKTGTPLATVTSLPTTTPQPTATPLSSAMPLPTGTPSDASAVNPLPTVSNPLLTRRTLTHDGEERIYFLHVPEMLEGPAPVVLIFTGNTQTSYNMSMVTGLSEMADDEGFIAVYPKSLEGNGLYATVPEVGVDDLGFLRAILAVLETEYDIDMHRVYATGNSNGAFFAQRVACEMADTVAAVASVSGTMPESIADDCQPTRPISVMLIHGTDDYVVPFNGQPGRFLGVPATFDLWRQINDCNENFISAQMADRANDGMRVQQIIANECSEGTEVVLIAVQGGGHAWPGGSYVDRQTTQDINASIAMWQFFVAHPLP